MTAERILKSCPRCGPATPLIKRINRHNGSEFLGCSLYPHCNHTEAIPEWYRMLDDGHQMLPGFEEQSEYYEWTCPRCGASLPSTEKGCPCEYDVREEEG